MNSFQWLYCKLIFSDVFGEYDALCTLNPLLISVKSKYIVAATPYVSNVKDRWLGCYIPFHFCIILDKDVTHYDHHSELLPDNPHPIKKAPTPHYLGMCLSNALVYTCEPSWVTYSRHQYSWNMYRLKVYSQPNQKSSVSPIMTMFSPL
jgi:hypothetical protein